MNWLLLLVIFILIWRIAEGYKRGMVKEIVSFVSLIVLCLAVAFLGGALIGYLEKDFVIMVVAIILLLVLCIAHRVLSFFFFSAKLVAKLPVIKFADKLLGAVIGVAETILLVWTLYTLLITVDTGAIGQQILIYVQDSKILTFIYEYNYLAKWVSMALDRFSMLPL